MPQRLLLVEDDDAVRRSLEEALREAGYDVSVAEHAEQALARLPLGAVNHGSARGT